MGYGDIDQGLTAFTPGKGLLALMGYQFRLTPHHYSARFGAFSALCRTAADTIPLELGQVRSAFERAKPRVQYTLKVRPARCSRRLRNAGPINAPGVQVPPSPCTSRTRQRALSAIILLVEP